MHFPGAVSSRNCSLSKSNVPSFKLKKKEEENVFSSSHFDSRKLEKRRRNERRISVEKDYVCKL
jgi:hypothetical protein